MAELPGKNQNAAQTATRSTLVYKLSEAISRGQLPLCPLSEPRGRLPSSSRRGRNPDHPGPAASENFTSTTSGSVCYRCFLRFFPASTTGDALSC